MTSHLIFLSAISIILSIATNTCYASNLNVRKIFSCLLLCQSKNTANDEERLHFSLEYQHQKHFVLKNNIEEESKTYEVIKKEDGTFILYRKRIHETNPQIDKISNVTIMGIMISFSIDSENIDQRHENVDQRHEREVIQEYISHLID